MHQFLCRRAITIERGYRIGGACLATEELLRVASAQESPPGVPSLEAIKKSEPSMTSQLNDVFATVYCGKRNALYFQTRNPLHAWEAYRIARASQVEVPAWVLTYMDQVAGSLLSAKGRKSAAACAEALGLSTRGGPSLARQAETDARDLMIVERIDTLQCSSHVGHADYDLRDKSGIMQRVADEYQLSVDHVHKIYSRLVRRPPAGEERSERWSGRTRRGTGRNSRRS
jgi:hypothetical protein